MLKYLGIKNIAVIEETEIDFLDGLNVLTGETGAGKSIIIDSINAVLGERTSKDLIRTGCDKASVTALFFDLSEDAVLCLNENGYDVDSEGNLLVSRSLSKSGSTVKINGKTATVGILNQIAGHLVNIHGQHDSQFLLNPDNHYLYIDKLAENTKELKDYYDEFKNLNSIRRKLFDIETDEDEKQRRKSYLEYLINELEKAKIQLGERDKIKEQLLLAESYEKTMSSLNNALSFISGDEESSGALSLVLSAQKNIMSLKSDDIKDINDSLCNISAELENVGYSIEKYTDSIDNSVKNKDELRERLDVINGIIRKYGGSEEEALKTLKSAKTELEEIEISDELQIKLSGELDASTERLVALGEKLTESRKIASKKFAKDVTEILNYLDMQGVIFDVSVENGKYTKHGCDVVEFIVKTNIGEDFKPLVKIASGGELSRIMLAIKSVLAEKDDVDTLIFDEIDTGISGVAAGKVGVQLKKVANCRQVICVTHLAQICAYGKNHLKITKSVSTDRTYTKVQSLDYEGRIEEIARIMTGTVITENIYNSAKELLDRSKDNGNL